MYIKRNIEDVLLRRALNSRCILITGARQVGKSTLLKKLYPNVKYVTFDDKILLNTAIEDPKLFIKSLPKPTIIDEVQYAPNIFPYIKMECDKADKYENYYLTSSKEIYKMSNLQESLAGRVSILELQCLSLRELHGISFNKHFVPNATYISEREKELKPYDNLWKTIHHGMYPEMHVTQREWQDFYSAYVSTYLERDIKEELEIKDSIAFTRFLTSVAARTGQMLNYSSIAEEVGVTQVTIKNWISVLERTGIIYILQPYYSNHLTRAIKTPKLYFRDTGLACYLTKWNSAEALEQSAVVGNMFETFVISEILKSFTNEGSDYTFNVFYYRGKDKAGFKENEIDLIIEENGTLYPIEIKKSANPNKSMASAFNVLDKDINKKRGTGAIVCLYDNKLYLDDNLVVLPIEYI